MRAPLATLLAPDVVQVGPSTSPCPLPLLPLLSLADSSLLSHDTALKLLMQLLAQLCFSSGFPFLSQACFSE